jgi:hypothetical protein
MPARHLPAHPNLDQYKKQAKDLLKRWKSDDPNTTRKQRDASFNGTPLGWALHGWWERRERPAEPDANGWTWSP